jgi:hypothetical protein
MQVSYKIAFFTLVFCFIFSACQDSKPQVDSAIQNTNEIKTSPDSVIEESEKTEGSNKYELPNWPVNPKEAKGKLYPFDEASKDAGFVKFRQELYNAVKEKDIGFLKPIISDSIFFSFGGEAGKVEFIKSWSLDSEPNNSGIWKELALCIELGGKFNNYDDQIRFMAPYIHMVDAFEDSYEEGVIVGDNVRLRDKPGKNAKIIGSLSWDHITFLMEENAVFEEIDGKKYPWVHIKTLNGEEGYVFGKYTRSPIDYRVSFVKQTDDNWQMEFFIAGD